jgi:tetratricopeptide (TPR) repeat protein
VLAIAGPAYAGDEATAGAREHYTRGQQRFQAGDFRGAIAEFAKAGSLSPSPVLDFNIGLCHERLGERDEAVRRYRAYVEQLPNAANRRTVEEKIGKLEAELAEEARLAEAKRKAEEARLAEDKRKAEEARLAEEARRAEESRRAGAAPPVPPPSLAPAVPPAAPPPSTAPSSPPPATGDPELDRVAALDVRAIRDARRAGRTDGFAAGPGSTGLAPAPAPAPPPTDSGGRKGKPAYKQWWFWVVVGVSAIILIDIATSDSQSAVPVERQLGAPSLPTPPLLRF